MSFNLGVIHEAIADAIPDREALVTATRRLTWRDVQMRSRRLANLLRAAGLGCRKERAELAPWESGQDHLALYLYNGHEYLEGMLGAYKARVAPFNVNYRYVAEELLYVLRDAGTRGIVFHASFAPLLREVLPQLPPMPVLLQVDDGSGEPLLPGGKLLSGTGCKVVTDGPYTEGKEVVGGYLIVNAKDMDEAVSIAKACPDFDLGGTVQVRQVMKMDM